MNLRVRIAAASRPKRKTCCHERHPPHHRAIPRAAAGRADAADARARVALGMRRLARAKGKDRGVEQHMTDNPERFISKEIAAMRIYEPGIYDIPADAYHADPCPQPSLSSSIAKMLVQPGGTPWHAWTACPRLNPAHEHDESERFDLGTAAHAMILRDASQAFVVIDAPDWRSKDAKLARGDARSAGKIPILTAQYESVVTMATAARKQLDAHDEGAAMFRDGSPEQTIIWREGEIWCRARLDWRNNTGIIFPDYKSTGASADPDLWSRTMYGMGADIQAAFYLRGIRALGLCDKPEWRFVVQENYAPYALSVIGLAPSALDLAAREVEKAIRIWTECQALNRWPGYPRRTCWIEPPSYHEAQIMAREIRDHDATQEALARGAESQRPL